MSTLAARSDVYAVRLDPRTVVLVRVMAVDEPPPELESDHYAAARPVRAHELVRAAEYLAAGRIELADQSNLKPEERI